MLLQVGYLFVERKRIPCYKTRGGNFLFLFLICVRKREKIGMADQEAKETTPISSISRDSPQLVALLKEMKDGLDAVRSKVQTLTQRVKEGQLQTADGMSYLEAKHLLLLSYCQSVVYYLLRKAKGLSIEGHPVVKCLVEIRLFLEKIRPIDKKMEYQVQKLTKAAANSGKEKAVASHVNEKNEGSRDAEDPLKYRPNPDMLVQKINEADQNGGVYRPPRFAPTTMEDEDMDKMSKQEKQALRRERELLRQTKRSSYMKELIDDIEDRPEEYQETVGSESRELSKYLAKREQQDRLEEDIFTRAPVSKRDKQLEKHLKKSRNGLSGLTDGFHEVLRMLPQKENDTADSSANMSTGGKVFKKRKRKY